MRAVFKWICAGALLAGSVAAAEPLPAFGDFPAGDRFAGKPSLPQLSTPQARRFRTLLRDEAARGPNFAGHYTVARWGCGAGCISWAIIDARGGRVWFAPFTVAPACADDSDACLPSLEFRPDSELMVISGARNEQGAGRYFYRWHAGVLTLLKAVERSPLPVTLGAPRVSADQPSSHGNRGSA